MRELSISFKVAGNNVVVSASAGVALSTHHSRARELLREADRAMYHAKAAGRACYRVAKG